MHNIALIPGDGIGPEVTAEALKVLEAAARYGGFTYDTAALDFGGDRYLRTGETLPNGAIDELRGFDAIFLGAIGHADVAPGILEKNILLRIRFELDQYINLRPVKLYPNVETPLRDKGPEDIDFVVVRENTEGLYSGMGGVQYAGTPNEVSTQVHGTWWRAFNDIGDAEFPDVSREYAHVDAATMWFVKNPESFDVIVTENLFGDIITDLGAMIQGGMGIAAGGNINPGGVSMFEPIGGSAPKYAGQGVINPLAAINAMQMLLTELGETSAAARVEAAVVNALESGRFQSMSAGRMGMTTGEAGDFVASLV